MTQLLIKAFIKDHSDTQNIAVRQSYGKLAGIVGVFLNIILAAAKFFAGIISGSISITADAVNNLSDSVASIVVLAAFKLSEKPADEDHPYGHARYEYISGVIVSCLIIVVGFQFLVSSFQKILHPVSVQYGVIFWVILSISIVMKLWLRLFNAKIGRIISSSSLAAAAADSRNDAIITSVVLVSAVISRLTNLTIDGYIGILVAAFILYSGIELTRQTLSPLLGEAPDKALVEKIQKKILSYKSVVGLHDLMVHNYGPKRRFVSVHVEFPANQDIMISHDVIDAMEIAFASEMQISLVVHLDPVVTDDPALNALKDTLSEIVRAVYPKLDIHDFRVVKRSSHSNLVFDIVVPPECKLKNDALREQISSEVKKIDENYLCVITIDRSYIKFVQPRDK